ncbi:MAG: TIGR02453 family protein [Marinovum sp.]|nr:TIGR02453 family protein [Marinovum sp.]
MSDAFDALIPDARAFLRALRANNSKLWFDENKKRYQERLKRPAELLLDAIQPALETLCAAPVKTKLFRPHRDVRFSTDKTPYHTYLHMLWAGEGHAPGFFFGISPDYATAGMGWMRFEGAHLAAWREGIGAPEGAEIQGAMSNLKPRIDAPELKRVPAPFDADHPRADLLRRKSFVVWRDGLDVGAGPLHYRIEQAFRDLWPAVAPVQGLLA